MNAATLDTLAARHLGDAPGAHRDACPLCAKKANDDAVSVTVNADGTVVAHCHRCNESGTARPDRVNGARRSAPRAKAAPLNHAALWASGTESGAHAYLTRKRVGAHGVRVAGDLLLVPMRNPEGALVGVEKIYPDGKKLHVKGSKKTGAFHLIGTLADTLCIAEGYATGASIHEATGYAVAVAFDAGNLAPVARALRAKHPTLELVVAADDDIATPGNPGLTQASKAARAVGARLAVPKGAKDFNDLAVERGAEAVRACFTVDLIDGAALLDAVAGFLCRFVAYPSPDAAIAHTLWIAHCHLMNEWESTPRVAFLSPEPSSGKTRALELTETLVPRPVESVNATAAYLFRKVSDPDGLPTILYDEIDTIFGPRAKDHEEVRGLINAGHRRGAMAGRCVVRGKTIDTEELPAFCAVALAGIGNLPDTILSRSIIVRMRRRAPTETIEPYRRRIHAPIGNALRDRLAAWATSVADKVRAVPLMPAGIEDRNADVWESLLAVADAAGGPWPTAARVSAVTLVTLAMQANPSLGIRLLADLRQVFEDRDAMFSEDIVNALCNLEEAPWNDLRGKPINQRALARLLNPYGAESRTVRIGPAHKKGYYRADLHDAWVRYLGPPASVTSVTNGTDNNDNPP